MDAKVHPLVAVLVIVLTIVGAGVWNWANGKSKEFGGPAGLTVDPDGHLYIQVRNQLLEHDEFGQFVQRHDLADFGIDLLLGGTGFFSNGDILLRTGPDTRSFFDNFRAFERRTNQNSLDPDVPATGLHRCNLASRDCSVFGTRPIDFKAAFAIYIDWQTDNVYISDSSRHLVRKYSSDGQEVATPAAGFKFPNQLMLHEQQLFVADTNHHRIRVVKPDTEGFGTESYNIDVVPESARSSGQKWPSHFVRVGSDWWVNNMQTGMDYGGIYIFDAEWRFKQQVALPGKADPIALRPFAGEVLISDWYGNRVHRVAANGDVLGDFQSEGLEQVLDEADAGRSKYQLYAWAGVGNCAVLIIILLVKGVSRNPPAAAKKDEGLPPTGDELIWLEPDPESVRKMRFTIRLARWLMLPLLAVLMILTWIDSNANVMYDLLIGVAGLVAIYFLVAWMVRVSTRTAIGIHADRVTLRDHTGREVTSPLRQVFYTDQYVASGDIAVFLGQPQTQIYDKKQVLAVLASRLPRSQRISLWAMQKKLIHTKHPHGTILVAAIVLLAVAAVLLLFRTAI